MPDVARAVSGIPRADPGGRVTPRFWHRLNRFRHFCGGSLALASLDRACQILVPSAFHPSHCAAAADRSVLRGMVIPPDWPARHAILSSSAQLPLAGTPDAPQDTRPVPDRARIETDGFLNSGKGTLLTSRLLG